MSTLVQSCVPTAIGTSVSQQVVRDTKFKLIFLGVCKNSKPQVPNQVISKTLYEHSIQKTKNPNFQNYKQIGLFLIQLTRSKLNSIDYLLKFKKLKIVIL
jgi:hypothetical protein